MWGAAATQGQLIVSCLPPSFCSIVLVQLHSADVQSAVDVCCALFLSAIRVFRVRAPLPRCRMRLH